MASIDNITVSLTFTRVDTDGSAIVSGHDLRPVEYGKINSNQTAVVAPGGTDTTDSNKAYNDMTTSAGYHTAVVKVDGTTLVWDGGADTYIGGGYDWDSKDPYAIYKVGYTASYTADQREAFKVAHGDGMRSVISFAQKSGDEYSLTGFWTQADNPGNYTTAPGSNNTFNLDFVNPTGTSKSGDLGYLIIYLHGATVTDDYTVGVTASGGDWADL